MKLHLEPHDVALVLGIRGSGKSRFVKDALAAPLPCVVFDPHGEYGSPNLSKGSPAHEAVRDLTPLNMDHLAGLIERGDLGPRVSVRPESSRGAHVREAFGDLAELAECLHDRVLVVEEAGLVCEHAREALAYLATQSRHWRLPLVLVAQRPFQLTPTIREQASVVVAHRLTRRADLEALADRIGEERAAAVAELDRGAFILWREADEFGPRSPSATPSKGKAA